MGRTRHTLRAMIIGVAAAGTVVVGIAGTAGAVAPVTGAASHSARADRFNCARAPRALARIQRIEANITAGLPKLHRAEARAKAAGNTQRVARIQKRISRLDSPAVKSRLDRQTARINARCSVPTPATGSTTPTTAPGT